MFSQTTEYALRAAVNLAAQPNLPVTTARLSELTKTPADYLSKVLQTLTRAGLIQSARGPNGGHRLKRPSNEITVLDVVSAVQPMGRIHVCPLGLPEHQVLCPMHQQIGDALANLECQLRSRTLAELVETRGEVPSPG